MAKYRVRIKNIPYVVEVPDGATDEQIAEAVSIKHGDQVWGDKMIQNELDAQKQAYKEQATTYQSYGRSDAILKDIAEKGKRNYDQEIRDAWKQESNFGKKLRQASDAGDKAAYDKAYKDMSPFYDKRQALLKEYAKVDPIRADALDNELMGYK